MLCANSCHQTTELSNKDNQNATFLLELNISVFNLIKQYGRVYSEF